MYFLCVNVALLQPPGANSIAINKYIVYYLVYLKNLSFTLVAIRINAEI